MLSDVHPRIQNWSDWVLQNPGPIRLADFAGYCIKLSESLIAEATEASVKNGQRISCRKGCASCCSQVVPVSPAEVFYLVELLTDPDPDDPTRSPWVNRVLENFRVSLEKINSDLTGDMGVLHEASQYFSLELPCPFLFENACSIHSTRPFACREHLVFSDPIYCKALNTGAVQLLEIPTSIREGLALVVAEALGTCQEMIPLTNIFAWAKEHEWAGSKTFPTKYLVDLLIKKIQ